MGVILIAFEREAELSALDQLLSGKGHRVVRSGNGLAALDAARREPPHAIVSDIVLPRMDGFALCRKWKQDERLQTIPFVFYTRRHDDPKYERFALELGAERFLARSVPPETLVAALEELLANVRRRTAAAATPQPLPTLDETVIQRQVVAEKAQRAAAEAERAQRQAELEKAQRGLAELEKAQRAAEAEKAQHLAELNDAQRKQSEAAERAQQAQARLLGQIEELEATNRRLAAGEARFRRVFEANPLPMWIADRATGGFIAVNDAALALYGYSRAEFLALKGPSLEAPDAEDGARDLRTSARTAAASRSRSPCMKSNSTAAAPISCLGLRPDRARCDRAQAARRSGGPAQGSRHHAHTGRSCAGRLLDSRQQRPLARPERSVLPHVRLQPRRVARHECSAQIEDQSTGETTMRLQLGRVQGGGRYETKHRCRDGSLLDVEVSVGVMEAGAGDSMVLIRDASQRRREVVAQRAGQRQLEFLVDLFKQAENFDESALVRRVIDQAADATGSPLAYMYFVDPARKTIALAAWRDRSQPLATMVNAEPRPIARAGLFTECVRAQHATSSNDLTRKPQQDGLPDLQRYLAVPMVADDETVAVLGVANREAGYGEDRSARAARARRWRLARVAIEALACRDAGLVAANRRGAARHDRFDGAHGRAARSVHRRVRRVVSLRWPWRSAAKQGSMASASTRCVSPRCCTTSATSLCRRRFSRSPRRSPRPRSRSCARTSTKAASCSPRSISARRSPTSFTRVTSATTAAAIRAA